MSQVDSVAFGRRSVRAMLLAALMLLLAGGRCPKAAGAASGQLVLSVVDRESGEPIACRVHLKTAAGRPRKPKKAPYWHDHFLVDGSITLKLPLGQYFFEMERGPEYTERSGRFTINRFAEDSHQVDMFRFVDMSSHGWWSGDLDVRRPIRDIELIMRAEDLHVVPLVTWTAAENSWKGKLPGELLVRFDDNRLYHLMGGLHSRAGTPLSFFNLKRPLELAGTSDEYPPPSVIVDRAREEPEAWIDLAKPFGWDLPLLVAHQKIDSIQVAHSHLCRGESIDHEGDGRPRDTLRYAGTQGNGRYSEAIYHHLLNCGIRIPPTAGSGSGESPNPAGYNRVYVHVEGELTYARWWDGLRAGRVVVTNGPLLRPSVQGKPPGHVFRGEVGQPMEFEIGLSLSTRRRISYLEIVKDGRVAHSIRFAEYAKSGRLPRLEFTQSGWFLVRAVTDLGKTYRFAMTGPYYVEIGNERRISKRSAEFFLDWVYERARQIELTPPARQREVIALHRRARDFWRALLTRANAE